LCVPCAQGQLASMCKAEFKVPRRSPARQQAGAEQTSQGQADSDCHTSTDEAATQARVSHVDGGKRGQTDRGYPTSADGAVSRMDAGALQDGRTSDREAMLMTYLQQAHADIDSLHDTLARYMYCDLMCSYPLFSRNVSVCGGCEHVKHQRTCKDRLCS
jgi:hypothetical protein